jgi:lipopolysaccharide/colanic/teichoic acid biosynthesis glycosyltransferase
MRSSRVVLVLGTVAAVVGLAKLHADLHNQAYTGWSRYGWATMYIVALCVSAYAAGLPTVARGRDAVIAALAAAVGAAIVVSLVQLVAGDALLPRFVVFAAPLVLVPWYAACAGLAWRGRASARRRDRVVLVGCLADAEAIRHDLNRSAEREAQLVACVTPEDVRNAGNPHAPLVTLVARERATILVLAQKALADENTVAQAADLHMAGVRVRTLSGFCEEWLGKVPISELERIGVLFDIGDLHSRSYARVKRVIDVSGALIGAGLLALLVPLVLVGNVVANRGSLFFRQPRVGRNGEEFEIIKLRTMRASGARCEGEWTTLDDSRITPFGRVLRRSHVDELPQVLNVLRGEVTLVGPRPEQPHYVNELTSKIGFYDVRHLVRPGLTGWAQVKYHYGSTDGDALEKLQYDFYYLRNQGVALDLRVIQRTLRQMLQFRGR